MKEEEKEKVFAAGCLLSDTFVRSGYTVDSMDEKTLVRSIRLAFRHKESINVCAFALHQGYNYVRYNPEALAKLLAALTCDVIPASVKEEIVKQMKADNEKRKENREKPSPSPRKTKIYLMLNSRNGYYKIGHSSNPKAREGTLQSEEPEVSLVKFWDGTTEDEINLHNAFADHRVRGEWFKLSQEHLGEIEKLMEGSR